MSGLILPTEHSAKFKALATEAKTIIDQEFGRANDYSMNLLSAVRSGAGSFFGGERICPIGRLRRAHARIMGSYNLNSNLASAELSISGSFAAGNRDKRVLLEDCAV